MTNLHRLKPQTSEEINELIVYMSEQLEISIAVTHDMHSVLQIAEKVAFLDQEKNWLVWDCGDEKLYG